MHRPSENCLEFPTIPTTFSCSRTIPCGEGKRRTKKTRTSGNPITMVLLSSVKIISASGAPVVEHAGSTGRPTFQSQLFSQSRFYRISHNHHNEFRVLVFNSSSSIFAKRNHCSFSYRILASLHEENVIELFYEFVLRRAQFGDTRAVQGDTDIPSD